MQPSSRSLLPIVIINIICVADITDTKTKLIDSGPAPIPHLKFDYLRFLYYEICYNIGTGTIIWNDSFVISKGENKLFVPIFIFYTQIFFKNWIPGLPLLDPVPAK